MTPSMCSSFMAAVVFLFVGSAFFGITTNAYASVSSHDLHKRDYRYTFEEYLQEYGKQYHDYEEYNMRRQLFEQRLQEIRAHNEDPERARFWRKGVNAHTDLTVDERQAMRGYDRALGHYTRAGQELSAQAPSSSPVHSASFPRSLDWRTTPGVLTAIKNQGNCGGCWAFAATEVIESRWFLATGRVMDLSVQDIISCAPNPDECGGKGGCDGATAQVAFSYVENSGGLSSEWTEPYLQFYNATTTKCPDQKQGTILTTVESHVNVPSNNLFEVLKALQSGPVAVSLDASGLHEYESGVFNSCNPQNTTIDHAVVLVGYGEEEMEHGETLPFWIIRNSWGPDLGENGFFRITRELETPKCGKDLEPWKGSACKNSPKDPVTVCGTCGILYDVSYPIIRSPSNDFKSQ